MNRVQGWLCAGFGALALAAPAATAQDRLFDKTANRPTGYGLPFGDWSFVAVVERGLNGEAFVPGVLALYDKDLAVGENIVAVWYERPSTPGQAWATKAWEGADQWEAIKWAKESFSISDDFDGFWPTKDVLTAAAAATPVDYDKGVLATDPLATIMDDPNRDAIVEILANMGYKAADISLEKTTSCEAKTVLDGYAATVEFAVTTFGPGAPGWGVGSWNGQNPDQVVDTFLSVQVPHSCLDALTVDPLLAGTVPMTRPSGPVIPGSWVPSPRRAVPLNPGRGFQRDSQPPVLHPACSTATTCCYQASVIFIYLDGTTMKYCSSVIEFSCPTDANGGCPATSSCAEPVPGAQGHFPPPGVSYDCGNSYP